ncbi:MAG: hypothetical protein PHZ09_14245 [Eubacteriales bacterium]|nr:hypothetical protein [Eubacteriales bacterium]
MKRRTFLLITAALLILFSGCAEADGIQSAVTVAEAETEANYIDLLPAGVYYDGYVFNIGWGTPYDADECASTLDEAAGDIVKEAVYERNRRAEDRLGIAVASAKLGEWTNLLTVMQNLNLSGDTSYDAYCASTWFMFQSSINGLLYDLYDVSSLDTTHDWWDGETIGMYTLGSRSLYFVSGMINYHDDYATTSMYFNKKLCDDSNLAYPYDLVRNGGWTYETFWGYIADFSADLNGDGKFDENDRYGYMENAAGMSRMLNAFGESVVAVGEDGTITVNDSERVLTIITRVFDQLFGISNTSTIIAERKLGYDKAGALFPNGQVLFMGDGMVGSINNYRQTMTDDFGVIPFPKYDESQEKFLTMFNTAWGTVYGIPITNGDTERTGYILDVMGYYSTDTINTAVIERNVLTKATRDDDSAEMLEIIFRSKFFELGSWGTTIYGSVCGNVNTGKDNFALASEKARQKTESEFAAVREYYKFG